MKRYIFLMLAFFLSFTQAFAIGISAPSISASPAALASVEQAPTKKELKELGSIKESEIKAQQPDSKVSLKKPAKNKVLTTASCRSYENKVYDLGEAGYNDCVEKIKSHKQARTTK